MSATGLSSLGDAAWLIALTAVLVDVGSATAAGVVLALAGLPRVCALVGGAVVDRWGPTRVMVWADLLRCAVMLGAAGTVLVTGPSVLVLAVVAAVMTALSAFFGPASGALRPLLLPDEHLVRGNSLYLIGLRAGQTAGGPVGAALLPLGGVVLVALANAVSFLVSAAAVKRVGPPAEPPRPGGSPRLTTRVAEGFRHVVGDAELRVLLPVMALVELAAAGPVNIGLVLLADHAGAGAAGAGLLLAATTVGATASFLGTLVLPAGRRAGAVLLAGVVAQAAVLACLGLVGTLPGAVLCYGLLGLVTAQSGVVLVSLVQRRTPVEVRGRVMSILQLVVFSAPVLGNLGFGALLDLAGAPATMALHGLLAAAAAAVLAATPALRTARLG
ncbi:MFS transporter [Saccharothrix lopnurensis]|uniref:MFS transporter n=1 Tax=Saccharothrix lopnurensis TaxID=1670621 RepID=A0ABW1PDY1_9PSEU